MNSGYTLWMISTNSIAPWASIRSRGFARHLPSRVGRARRPLEAAVADWQLLVTMSVTKLYRQLTDTAQSGAALAQGVRIPNGIGGDDDATASKSQSSQSCRFAEGGDRLFISPCPVVARGEISFRPSSWRLHGNHR
jgi:hypothetical protein